MSVKELAKKYNKFQNNFGSNNESDCKSIIEDLFSHEFKKVANGQILISRKDEIENQLNGVKDFAGNWSITEKLIIPSQDNKICTIRYLLESEKAGIFDIIAILTSSNGSKIDSIDEIYYQLS